MIKLLRLKLPEYVFLGLILLTFLMGGSSRDDTASLVILRPAALLAMVFAIVWLPKETWRANRTLIILALLWVGFVGLHLIPLPPFLWQALPGRDLAEQIGVAVGIQDQWRPLSLVPHRTLNALFALALPLAVLLLGLSVSRKRLAWTIYIVLFAVLGSAALGLLQMLGGDGSAFYTYRVTNAGSAVGFFANRNHQASMLVLVFPLIAAALSLFPVSREHVRAREWMAAGFALLLIPFLLMTQSRSGIILGVIGLASVFWVYRSPADSAQRRRVAPRFDPRIIFGAMAVGAVGILTLVFTRNNALERIGSTGKGDDELRLQIWGPITDLAMKHLPFGSGIGTFVEVYQAGEPASLLRPQYTNHAHNDVLELLLTGGLPFILLAILGIILIGRIGWTSLRDEKKDQARSVRRLGAVALVILGISSLYDYPLRTPLMAMILALSIVWFAGRSGEENTRPVETRHE